MNDDSFIFMTVKEMNLTDSDKHIQTFSQSKADFIDSFNELSIKLNYFFRFKLYPRNMVLEKFEHQWALESKHQIESIPKQLISELRRHLFRYDLSIISLSQVSLKYFNINQ